MVSKIISLYSCKTVDNDILRIVSNIGINCSSEKVGTVYLVQFILESVDKQNQLDVIFCIFYFSSNGCSTCFGQPCAHHQELTTA